MAALAVAPTAMILVNGQTGFLVGALLGLALLEIDRRPFRAGLLLGLHCVTPNSELVARLQDQGLLAVPAAENVVRLLPPLIAEESHMEAALAILDRVCAEAAEGA